MSEWQNSKHEPYEECYGNNQKDTLEILDGRAVSEHAGFP
jgi:hypothetical protein